MTHNVRFFITRGPSVRQTPKDASFRSKRHNAGRTKKLPLTRAALLYAASTILGPATTSMSPYALFCSRSTNPCVLSTKTW